MSNCISLKQKLNRTLFCKKKKRTISFKDCANCEFKEYKCTLKDKKNKSNPSKRTKATSIPKKTKLIVWERDKHKCIFCHKEVEWNFANSHFIKRSHGGLGIKQNLFTACIECHHKFDDSIYRKDMLPTAEQYLKSFYKDWNKENLIYKKY